MDLLRENQPFPGSFHKEQYLHRTGQTGGANNFRIMTGYIIPNVMPSLLVNITQDIGSKLLTIAGLSLLGLGSQPPTPEWGYMLSEGKDYMYSAPWMLMAPGMVILINVIIFNLLGDCIQDLMNPKGKK